MQRPYTTTCSILCVCALIVSATWARAEFSSSVSIQADGSLVFFDSSGGIADLVKQGTPRQAVSCGGQSLNVSYGSNSAGKKTILISLPKTSASAANFILSDMSVSIPPGSSLRVTLSNSNQPERLEGAPAGSVNISKSPTTSRPTFEPSPAVVAPEKSEKENAAIPPSPLPTQTSPNPNLLSQDSPQKNANEFSTVANVSSPTQTLSSPAPPQPMASPEELSWPGKFLDHPIPADQMEEDHFYIRTEGGARFVSSMNIVNVVGTNGPSNSIIQKEIAFSTGYRQDVDAGVWLTDWFGLAIETGFALNAIRGNTQGMTVSSSNYWSVPIMAQLCFQYPNDSGFLPYINFGFGGGWNYFKIGSINYTGQNFTTLSGSGNDMNNAYQIAAGVRYRLYDQLSLTLAYKFYGTSQPTVDMGDNQQVTFGSPVTNTIEIGGNFAF